MIDGQRNHAKSSVREHVRSVLSSLPDVADTAELAAVVIARMSEQERYDTLLRLLPQLIRDEDRRRAQIDGNEADTPAAAWALTTEHRVRVDGVDMFLSDADADDVDALAAVRRRSGQNMTANAHRYEELAEAMRSGGVETLAGLQPEIGLDILRQNLRDARRRVANRTALQRLADVTEELAESPGLAEARATLAAAEQTLAEAKRERARLEGLADTLGRSA